MASLFKTTRFSESARLACKYCALATLWIIGSDALLALIAGRRPAPLNWDTAKGLVFVAVTTGLLYALARRMATRLQSADALRQNELRRINEQLVHAKGIQAALTRASQAALTVNDEETLCRETCSALVGLGGLRLVWFGWVDESDRTVTVFVSAGDATGYLSRLHISIDPENPNGQGVTGRAIRENKLQVGHDILSDPRMAPWNEMLASHGLRASISAPLKVGLRRGAFTAYSSRTDFFDDEVVELVARLSADLGRNLELLAARVERAGLDARLRESETRYRLLFENEHTVMLLVDADTGSITAANPAAARFYGWPVERLCRMNISDINRASPADIAAQMRLAAGSTQHAFRFRHLRADGSEREVDVFTGPVRIDGRSLLYSIIHDVTERRVAELALADALALNDVALNNAPLGMVIHDAEGRVIRANSTASRILGVPPAELASQHLRDAPVWIDHGLLDFAERALDTETTERIEVRLPGLSGRPLRVDAIFTPFRFRGALRMLVTLEDVTERHRINDQLKLMQTAVNAAPSAIVVTDPQARIEWANPAFTILTGHSLDQTIGKRPNLLKSGHQDDAFYARLWATISRGEIWSGQLQNKRRDGSTYHEQMVIAPVLGPDRTILHYVAIKQDITAQLELEKQVSRAQRLESIGLLAGGIAHDLNNVLAPILMAMDIFKLRYPEPADQARFDMVRQSAQRGASIVRQVLTFARGIDGERAELQPRHLLKEVVELLSETMPRQIEILSEIPGELPSFTGDATQIHQVLLNLGVNARDAMPVGGELTFGAAFEQVTTPRLTTSGITIPAGDYVVLFVRDTGTGIPSEVLEHMFDPFFTTKPRGEGTGLGLSTTLGIVRSHGGGLDVATHVDKGTEFRVLLPACAAAIPIPEHPASNSPFEGRDRVILVVDDEEAIRTVIGLALDLIGLAHVEAADGRVAIELFEREPERFSAVILDRVMPRLSGDEVARRIKSLRPDLPIILISGQLEEQGSGGEEINAYSKFGDAVLRKPFSHHELKSAISRVLPAG